MTVRGVEFVHTCHVAVSKGGFVYINASITRVLYIGVTADIEARSFEHKTKAFRGFTARYNVDRLVYFEAFPDIESAIAREKQLKGWVRRRKIALIESANPEWKDLSAEWFDDEVIAKVREENVRHYAELDADQERTSAHSSS